MTPGRHRHASALVAAALVICATFAAAALAASTDFVEPATSPEATGNAPFAIASADFDGDADPDLAAANLLDDSVTVLKNNGSANFVEAGSSPEVANQSPRAIAAADFDGDADPDLALGNDIFPGEVTILRNNGAGNFSEAASSPEAAAGAAALTAGDLDADGDPDLAAVDPQTDAVTILRNNGSGNFSEAGSSPETVGNQPDSITAADLDGDGDPDLVVASQTSGDITLLRNNGAGNFSEPAWSPETAGDEVDEIVAADLDGDGDNDLAVAGGQELVTVLKNTGSGNFTEAGSSPEAAGGLPTSIVAADFDDDADPDLAVGNILSEDVTILRNNGSGNFSEAGSSPEAAPDPVAIAATDLDDDADSDLAAVDFGHDVVTILLNR